LGSAQGGLGEQVYGANGANSDVRTRPRRACLGLRPGIQDSKVSTRGQLEALAVEKPISRQRGRVIDRRTTARATRVARSYVSSSGLSLPSRGFSQFRHSAGADLDQTEGRAGAHPDEARSQPEIADKPRLDRPIYLVGFIRAGLPSKPHLPRAQPPEPTPKNSSASFL